MAWACSIARLKVLENFRQLKRVNVLSEAAIIALTEDAPSPDSIREREVALGNCLENVTPKIRDLLWRRYNRRQSSDEMAESTGMTSNAVRSLFPKPVSLYGIAFMLNWKLPNEKRKANTMNVMPFSTLA